MEEREDESPVIDDPNATKPEDWDDVPMYIDNPYPVKHKVT
jgi:hypothetical protein